MQICKYAYGYKKMCQHWKIMRCISINKYYKYFVHCHWSKACRGNHASICLRWLKLNQFLTLSSLLTTIKQALLWEYFSDVNASLHWRQCIFAMHLCLIAILWWLSWSVGTDWRSLRSLLPIIGDLCCIYCL